MSDDDAAPDGCGCQYDAAGRRYRTRCICPPPLTAERTLRGVAGLGGAIGDAVAGLLVERDEALAALDAARAEVERLAVSLLEEKREHLAAINVRDELTAQRDAVLEIHRIYPAAPRAEPYCEECPSDLGWPCSTARALGVE